MWSECEYDFAVRVFFGSQYRKFLLRSLYCVCGPEAHRNPEDSLRSTARLAKFGLKTVASVREGELANNAKKVVQFLQSSEGKTRRD